MNSLESIILRYFLVTCRPSSQLNSLLADRISQAEAEIAQRKRVEEQLTKLTREQQRSAKLSVASSSSASGNESAEIRELKEHNDDLSVSSNLYYRFSSVLIFFSKILENAQMFYLHSKIQRSYH